MTVYALFHDGTAKDVRIILNRNDKNFLEVGQIGAIKDSIFVSARNAIQQSWPLLLKNQLLEENKRYLLVTPLGLGREADGESAGLAFAAAFICKLSEEGFINYPLKISGNVAATGIIDDAGDVLAVTHIQEKALAAIERGCNCMFIPSKNEAELMEIPGFTERIQSAKLELIPIDSVQDLLLKLVGTFSTVDQPGQPVVTQQPVLDEIQLKKPQGKRKMALILLPAFAVLLTACIFLIRPRFLGIEKGSSPQYDELFENKAVLEDFTPTPVKYAATTMEIITPTQTIAATVTNQSPSPATMTLQNEVKTASTPLPVKATAPQSTKVPDSFHITSLCDSAYWALDSMSSNVNITSQNADNDGKILQVNYSLEKGESFKAFVKAADIFNSLTPYKNLKFYYKVDMNNDDSSTNNSQINCFIIFQNGSERNIEIGDTRSIVANQWNMVTAKGLKVNDIAAVSFFIGDIPFVNDGKNKGKLELKDFVVY